MNWLSYETHGRWDLEIVADKYCSYDNANRNQHCHCRQGLQYNTITYIIIIILYNIPVFLQGQSI